MNRRAAAGATMRFVKVNALRAETLNEAADAMASAAADLDPARPLQAHIVPHMVHINTDTHP